MHSPIHLRVFALFLFVSACNTVDDSPIAVPARNVGKADSLLSAPFQRAVAAALYGPELKKFEIAGHEFNIKQVTSFATGDTKLITGQLSHHLSFRPDDQVYFTIQLQGDSVERIEVAVNDGGLAPLAGPVGAKLASSYGFSMSPALATRILRELGQWFDGSWRGVADQIIGAVAIHSAESGFDPIDGAMEQAVEAALHGPERKQVNLFGHEFNVKPATIQHLGTELVIAGQISHHLTGRPDDQLYYEVVLKGREIVDIQVDVNRGGLAPLLAPFASLIASYYGIPLDQNNAESALRTFGALVDGEWLTAAEFLVVNIGMRAALSHPRLEKVELPDIAADNYVAFAMTVTADTPMLEVGLAGGSGDADLYVFEPTDGDLYWDDASCVSSEPGNEETCSFASDLALGEWIIVVRAEEAAAGVKLTIAF